MPTFNTAGVNVLLTITYHIYGDTDKLDEVGTFKIGGRIINKIGFADDSAIITKIQEELQDMVNRLLTLKGSMVWKSTLTNHK